MYVFKIITSSNRTETKSEVTRWVVKEVDGTTLDELKKKLRALFNTQSGQFFISWFDGEDYCTIRETCDLQDAVDFFLEDGKVEQVIRLYATQDITEHNTSFGETVKVDEEEKANEQPSTSYDKEDTAQIPRRSEILGEDIIDMSFAEILRLTTDEQNTLQTYSEQTEPSDTTVDDEPEQSQGAHQRQSQQQGRLEIINKTQQQPPQQHQSGQKETFATTQTVPQITTMQPQTPTLIPSQRLSSGDGEVMPMLMPMLMPMTGYGMPQEMMSGHYMPYYGHPLDYQGHVMPIMYQFLGVQPTPTPQQQTTYVPSSTPTMHQQATPSMQPPNTTTEPPQKNRSTHITSTLQALRRMGYTLNENYLLKLIKTNECNLNKIIDTIEKHIP